VIQAILEIAPVKGSALEVILALAVPGMVLPAADVNVFVKVKKLPESVFEVFLPDAFVHCALGKMEFAIA
jgi:hypothetical protein